MVVKYIFDWFNLFSNFCTVELSSFSPRLLFHLRDFGELRFQEEFHFQSEFVSKNVVEGQGKLSNSNCCL